MEKVLIYKLYPHNTRPRCLKVEKSNKNFPLLSSPPLSPSPVPLLPLLPLLPVLPVLLHNPSKQKSKE